MGIGIGTGMELGGPCENDEDCPKLLCFIPDVPRCINEECECHPPGAFVPEKP
ncbi:hypothetical protein TSUD_286780 [Trifolium subterraneum]|uniref:Late nodulin domain-containing protein n=1 Tax=Trifolium subterraneum TaxID=3900 RepID=A0A2Z6LU29_TRISU|nr:hypothetical protein TSUD_286780 [Trifolium subterraneum]